MTSCFEHTKGGQWGAGQMQLCHCSQEKTVPVLLLVVPSMCSSGTVLDLASGLQCEVKYSLILESGYVT